MANTHVFPQDGDDDDAANFGQLVGQSNLTGFVERGLDLTVNYTVPEATVSTGLAFVSENTATAPQTGEDRLNPNYAVQLSQTTVSLTDNDVNFVYVEPDLGTDDNASVVVYTNESNATTNALKIAAVDTSSDTKSELNRRPDLDAFEIDVADDIVDDTGTVIWDASNEYVPQGRLENDSVAVAGNNVSLGGSTTVNYVDLNDTSDSFPIPNGDLSNSSVTVSAGDGLKSGGSVSLGGSVTLNTEPADFAGMFLSDDGSDNLQVDIGRGLENDGTGLIQFDEDTAYTFTSDQTFNAGLNVATGQSIEDGSDTDRLQLKTNFTSLRYEDGFQGFTANDEGAIRVNARPETPFEVFDHNSNVTALEYRTSSSVPGTLELTNAQLDISGATRTILSEFDGSDVHWFKGPSGTEPGNLGFGVKFDSTNNVVDRVEIGDGADIGIAEGNGILDRQGFDRLKFLSSKTLVKDEGGSVALEANAGTTTKLFVRNGQELEVGDEIGGFVPLKYIPSSSPPGTLEISQATVDLKNSVIRSSTGPLRVGNGDSIHLDPNAISGTTETNGGRIGFTDGGSNRLSLNYNNVTPSVFLYDHDESQVGIEYNSGPTGELRLTNTDLKTVNNNIVYGSSSNVFSQMSHRRDNGNGAVELRRFIDSGDGAVLEYSRENQGTSAIKFGANANHIRVADADLRLDAGTSIEDGNENNRLSINFSSTTLLDEDKNTVLNTFDGTIAMRPATTSGEFKIRDQLGSFTAAKYSTSSSPPGEFRFTNTDVSILNGNTFRFAASGFADVVLQRDQDDGRLELFEANKILSVNVVGGSEALRMENAILKVRQGTNSNPGLQFKNTGDAGFYYDPAPDDVEAVDALGNSTVIV